MCINIFTSFVLLLVVSSPSVLKFVYSQSSLNLVEVLNESLTNNFFNIDENQIQEQVVSQNCTEALAVFAEIVTNLTRCTILNARPIRLCTNCEDEINATEQAYLRLQREPSACHKFYFESDHVGIIDLVYNQGRDLWSKSNCQDCYANINDTKEFFKISKDLDLCLKNFNQTSRKELNNTCVMCEELYVKMNAIYRSFVQRISSDESGGVCIDVIDQMNITRHTWSSQNCLNFDSNVGYPNIIASVVIGCIPVFFYMLSKSISNIEDIKLVRPKRKSFAPLQSDSTTVE